MVALKPVLNNLLHLFFPHVCVGCGSDILDEKHLLCLRCVSDLPVTNFFDQPGNPVEGSFYGKIPVRNAGAAYFFTKNSLVETLVYELKYRGNKEIGFYLGRLMAGYLVNNKRFGNIDLLVPLPLNPKRQKKRGYNQATALCDGIASVWNMPVENKAVVRTINSETQTHRGRVERWQNMQGIFSVVEPELLKNKHILLVDDVVTTGASLEACGQEILRVPATTLSIATMAYTI